MQNAATASVSYVPYDKQTKNQANAIKSKTFGVNNKTGGTVNLVATSQQLNKTMNNQTKSNRRNDQNKSNI